MSDANKKETLLNLDSLTTERDALRAQLSALEAAARDLNRAINEFTDSIDNLELEESLAHVAEHSAAQIILRDKQDALASLLEQQGETNG